MLSNSSAGNKDVIESKDKEIEQLKVQIDAATNQFRQSDKLRAAAQKKADQLQKMLDEANEKLLLASQWEGVIEMKASKREEFEDLY